MVSLLVFVLMIVSSAMLFAAHWMAVWINRGDKSKRGANAFHYWSMLQMAATIGILIRLITG